MALKFRVTRKWYKLTRRRLQATLDGVLARYCQPDPVEVRACTTSSAYTADTPALRRFVQDFCQAPEPIWERVYAPTDSLAAARLILDTRTPLWLDQVSAR
jgi:hypothetical protein